MTFKTIMVKYYLLKFVSSLFEEFQKDWKLSQRQNGNFE